MDVLMEKTKMPGEEEKKSKTKDPANENTRVYLKVYATFKCSKDNCGRTWSSAHGWERDGMDSVACESCNKDAELMNAVDEMLKLDCYNCPNKSCEGNFWTCIHSEGEDRVAQECDLCHGMVYPEKDPQERYGRHYFFACVNKQCKNQEQWEDFSTDPQCGQRCTKCHAEGRIIHVKKLKRSAPPLWMIRRREGGGKGGDKDRSDQPTTHNREFCDMCQKIKREGKGTSCHAYRKVITKMQRTQQGNQETIVGVFNRGQQ